MRNHKKAFLSCFDLKYSVGIWQHRAMSWQVMCTRPLRIECAASQHVSMLAFGMFDCSLKSNKFLIWTCDRTYKVQFMFFFLLLSSLLAFVSFLSVLWDSSFAHKNYKNRLGCVCRIAFFAKAHDFFAFVDNEAKNATGVLCFFVFNWSGTIHFHRRERKKHCFNE